MHLGKTVEQEYSYNLNVDNTAHDLRKIDEERRTKNKQSKQYHDIVG